MPFGSTLTEISISPMTAHKPAAPAQTGFISCASDSRRAASG
jgi:hypothetical protein